MLHRLNSLKTLIGDMWLLHETVNCLFHILLQWTLEAEEKRKKKCNSSNTSQYSVDLMNFFYYDEWCGTKEKRTLMR